MTLARTPHQALLFCLLAGLATPACVGDSVGSDSSYSTDSFSNPTEHGVLQFGMANQAEFTNSNRYHAWTFELTGEADVALTTELLAQNLDSVMYLYKKGESGSWGSYIDKNDDHGESLASRVSRQLDAGSYRVKIKAAKQLMRGSFSLNGSCDGPGCPTPDNGTCDATDTTLPQAGGYTQACAIAMEGILTSPTVAGDTSCFEERAVAYYKQYWDEIIGWEALTGDPEDEPSVQVSFHGDRGAVVGVGMGGDEDSMDFVFDANGKLIFYYQHNQSPDWAWFCDSSNFPVEPEPDEDCVTSALFNHDYDVQDVETAQGVINAGDWDTQGMLHVNAALKEYGETQGLSSNTPITYEATVWAGYYNQGGNVSLKADGADDIRYVVTGNPDYSMKLTFIEDAGGVRFYCKDH